MGASSVMTPPRQEGDEMGEHGEGSREKGGERNGGKGGERGGGGKGGERGGDGGNKPREGKNQLTACCVDIRGPDGYTPLMLASCKPSRHSSHDDEVMITTLIAQGAQVNATTDTTGVLSLLLLELIFYSIPPSPLFLFHISTTPSHSFTPFSHTPSNNQPLHPHPGETSLHLAARNGNMEASKHLLEAGGNPNARDCNGRTPLHAAIAADAKGVFNVCGWVVWWAFNVRGLRSGVVGSLMCVVG